MESRKEHWEKVYATKQPHEISWTQQLPKTSLDFVHSFNLPKTASIIDIGGGDSMLVDFLLEEGYENITVLDISEIALEKAKRRLGSKASKVNWITSDVTTFHPSGSYDCWHDRATFHFLTSSQDVNTYLNTAKQAVSGYMIIGTFSDKGPDKCSMLDVHKYTESELQEQLANGFDKLKCITEDHTTPFNTVQNFLFCSFKRSILTI
ncbi:MAG: methyltransferase domain-containing protein [Saprospiraceae bacterium]|uniref:Methyltransferase domain-containing protein n=1 Tax=Candidatus Opimibacter skivensis TaxID=2982028 RepID=A0A9D7SPV6_9BACT|nr:methyltransferase domain-containing protein [Candidatus Opimibacter skivensis]